ncbi:ORF127 [Ranid herpesvirus 1]|uniref:ORF127 n=1 Tax=Ranid herpesvirus 1 TaxID=85655 RepID=Q14VK3_9VIRU|nr:ORF127 [Ranid herpesvirus 1]ABG25758.1 ORF127 [Ranid herpesvirus 1]
MRVVEEMCTAVEVTCVHLHRVGQWRACDRGEPLVTKRFLNFTARKAAMRASAAVCRGVRKEVTLSLPFADLTLPVLEDVHRVVSVGPPTEPLDDHWVAYTAAQCLAVVRLADLYWNTPLDTPWRSDLSMVLCCLHSALADLPSPYGDRAWFRDDEAMPRRLHALHRFRVCVRVPPYAYKAPNPEMRAIVNALGIYVALIDAHGFVGAALRRFNRGALAAVNAAPVPYRPDHFPLPNGDNPRPCGVDRPRLVHSSTCRCPWGHDYLWDANAPIPPQALQHGVSTERRRRALVDVLAARRLARRVELAGMLGVRYPPNRTPSA